MILLSFAGFLRFDEVSSFLCSDVKIECEYLFLFIRKSKTDQYRNGNEVLIAKGETLTTNKSLLPKCILQSSKSISIETGSFFLFQWTNSPLGIFLQRHKLIF
jgi:hypothetical protein